MIAVVLNGPHARTVMHVPSAMHWLRLPVVDDGPAVLVDEPDKPIVVVEYHRVIGRIGLLVELEAEGLVLYTERPAFAFDANGLLTSWAFDLLAAKIKTEAG